jgi:hypothetical protein
MALPAPNTAVLAFDALPRSCVDDVHAHARSLLREHARDAG